MLSKNILIFQMENKREKQEADLKCYVHFIEIT